MKGLNDPDRLRKKKAIWTLDAAVSPTEAEIDRLADKFEVPAGVLELERHEAVRAVFRLFIARAEDERCPMDGGTYKKPATIVQWEMARLLENPAALKELLNKLSTHSEAWIDGFLKATGERNKSGRRLRLRDAKEDIPQYVGHLMDAARSAKGLTSPGPSNLATWYMINDLAHCWEKFCGKPATTDKARRLRNDPFLALCRGTAQIADARLREKDAGLGALILTGLVAEVLRTRATASQVSAMES